MAIDFETRVRERAYALWQQEGGGEGRALDHWSRAEREIAAMQEAMRRAGDSARPAPKKRSSVPAAPRGRRGKAAALHA